MVDTGNANRVRSSVAQGLSDAERERLAALKGARSLAELVELTDAADEHAAYREAKREWTHLRERDPSAIPIRDGLPGYRVPIGGRPFWVHGITHADSDAERDVVRRHVAEYLERGAGVYCEQGIRPMYLQDVDEVCVMDDYRWARQSCATGAEGAPSPDVTDAFEGVGEDVQEVRDRLREAAFTLVESRGDALGERIKQTLGALVAAFLTSHEALGTADDFASHSLSSRAAENPTLLAELQHYYATAFLPQPLEREWLRRHDPDLERATHARNERMADYAVYHADDVPEVHMIVGAAHQPGVQYYLERHRDGERDVRGFQLC